MSQNAHTLTLFFDQPLLHRQFQLLLRYLDKQDDTGARHWAQELGDVDLELLWKGDTRFNHRIHGTPTHLEYGFETSPSADLPWDLLAHLSRHGLQAAVLEVFYDQVGETERYYIDRGQWVRQADWLARYPQHQQGFDPEGECGATLREPPRPLPLAQVLAEQEERKRAAQETLQSFRTLVRECAADGVSPVQALIAAAVLRGALKGVGQALLFTTVTVLLFQGLWLWLGLGLALLVVLPLVYMVKARRDLVGDDDDDAPLAAAQNG